MPPSRECRARISGMEIGKRLKNSGFVAADRTAGRFRECSRPPEAGTADGPENQAGRGAAGCLSNT